MDTVERSMVAAMAHRANRDRIAIERELGMRSFWHFFKMCWPYIDAAAFVPNWHLHLMCETLQQVAMRQVGDTVICVPPRSSKSLVTSVAFPAWLWTFWPSCKTISASYDQRLASRDALKTRRLVESSWFKARWGDKVQLVKDQNQKLFYQTVQGGHRFTATPSMGVTGEGADFILFDDPHPTNRAESAADRLSVNSFWWEAIPSRLNNPTAGRKLVIQQRVHEADLAGQCIERGYNHLVLPALYEPDHPQVNPKDPRRIDGEPLWPARYKAADYMKLMGELGKYACTPYESPILMGDLTYKPIGEVVVGDTVVGFTTDTNGGKNRRESLQTKVTNTFKYKAEVVKMTLDSGRVIRCTADHQWYMGNNSGDSGYINKAGERHIKPLYRPAIVGRELMRISYPEDTTTPPGYERDAGWLAGFYDGDGSAVWNNRHDGGKKSCSIYLYQGAGRNIHNCNKLEEVLKKFGFEYQLYTDPRKKVQGGFEFRQYRLAGNQLPLYQKFLHIIKPTKWRERILNGAFGRKFILGKERVIKIEPDGIEDVYALETETGNYVVWGLGSSNSSGQYQQRPVPREGGMFNVDWFEIVDHVPLDVIKVRRWDFAYTAVSVGSDPDYTVGLLLGRSPSTKKFYVMDVQRMRKSFGEVEARVKFVASQDGRNTRIVLPIDPGAGKAQYEYFVKQLAGYPVSGEREDKNTGNKAIRLQPVAAQAEIKNFCVLRADWNRDFFQEIQFAPLGKHDDIVDALSGAFRALLDSSGGMIEYLAMQQREMLIAKGEDKPTNRVEYKESPWHAINQ